MWSARGLIRVSACIPRDGSIGTLRGGGTHEPKSLTSMRLLDDSEGPAVEEACVNLSAIADLESPIARRVLIVEVADREGFN